MKTVIMLFAGTTEGRQLCEYLVQQDKYITHVYVTTEYGGELLNLNNKESQDSLCIHVGKLDKKGISEEIMRIHPDIVIDATHPYARIVTQNVRESCRTQNVRYIRALREESEDYKCDNICDDKCNNKYNDIFNDKYDTHNNACTIMSDNSDDRLHNKVVYTDTMQEAVELLNSTEYAGKKVLFTTGSKSIPEYVNVSGYKDRAYIRLLPSPDMLRSAIEAGFQMSHLIGMQGPFSQEMNEAVIRQLSIDVLVTKESGSNGGFAEKIMAAEQTGVQAIVIRRPVEQDGLSVVEIINEILKK